jgi:capsular exopolysaccharide synthesis family protein
LAVLSIQLKEMRDRISGLDIKRTELTTTLENFEVAVQSDDSQEIVKLADNVRLTRLAKQLGTGSVSKLTFDALVTSILSKMRLDATRSNQQYDALIASEKVLKADITSQSADLVQLQQLQREAQANVLLYESFLSRLKETAVQQGLQKADSRLLSSAVPRLASSPRVGIILVLSAILGIMLGAGLVLLKELRNNTFRTSDDLEAYTGFGVLGSTPKIKAAARKDVLSYAINKPMSVFAEAIRNLRTSVLLSDVDNPPQVIMSTSSVPQEGKTTLSLTLAQNMAALGKKVLVVEGDVRKRVFAEYFNAKDLSGFLSVMSGKITIEDAVFQPEGMDIDVLIGEESTVNAADIFSSKKFADLIKTLRQQYDYIIIDTAPVLAVPDARVVGQYVDAIVYSVRWNSTTKTQVKQGLLMFSSVGLHVNGLVLNGVDSKEMKRYGYAGQYGYAYGDATGYYQN